MSVNKYITASCVISNGVVSKNGANTLEDPDENISAFLLSVYRQYGFNYPKFYKMDNLSKLGWLAAEILLQDSFNKAAYQSEEIGLILANANSSLDNDLKYADTIRDIPSPSVFVYTLPNIVIGEICIRHQFKGEHTFFIQEAFDAGFIARQVSYLLNNNNLQACICGWIDVLEQDYKAALFLVEKESKKDTLLFSAENMDKVFNDIKMQ